MFLLTQNRWGKSVRIFNISVQRKYSHNQRIRQTCSFQTRIFVTFILLISIIFYYSAFLPHAFSFWYTPMNHFGAFFCCCMRLTHSTLHPKHLHKWKWNVLDVRTDSHKHSILLYLSEYRIFFAASKLEWDLFIPRTGSKQDLDWLQYFHFDKNSPSHTSLFFQTLQLLIHSGIQSNFMQVSARKSSLRNHRQRHI